VVLPAESLTLGVFAAEHQAIVLLINKALGGIGKHFNYNAAMPINRVPSHREILSLVDAMKAGSVDLLFIKDANPAYSLPSEVDFAAAMENVGFTIAFADSENETVAMADLVIPVTHSLESWGEVNTYQGLDMLQQPVMRPRWDVRQAEDHLIELINHMQEGAIAETGFRDLLQKSWTGRFGADATDPSGFWRESLRLGGRFVMAEGADLPISGNLSADYFAKARGATPPASPALVIEESARFGDGRYANRSLMQELPDAMNGSVWDTVIEISYGLAEQKGVRYGDIVSISVNGVSIEAPACLSETQSDDVVVLQTGQGHTGFSNNYNRGANAFALMSGGLDSGDSFTCGASTVTIEKTGRKGKIATIHVPTKGDRLITAYTPIGGVKDRTSQDGFDRHFYGHVSLAEFNKLNDGHGDDHGGGHHGPVDLDSRFPVHNHLDFYSDRSEDPVVVGRGETFYDNYKWELAIDLNKCTGCGSCVTACYTENNVPIVGKDQVAKGREMAWIRINRYIGFTEKEGGKKEARAYFLPMMCQQCGNAPCESVCPSLATYHNKEGLNAMVYNRCVGTRYCANNCSYKVRRFNWFTWEWEGDQNWALNPAVSVRMKGVMEKCTFCVQRLRQAKDMARDQGQDLVRDGDVQTACQQACPSRAIAFGNVMDKESEIYELTHQKHAYRALDDHIKTKPGVSYLKRVMLEDKHHA
jgi:molybdopterin-containing oxidoreductase family iron-sulfur binding subunit